MDFRRGNHDRKNRDTISRHNKRGVVAHNAYDLKFLSNADLSYNPALGTGQLQVRDIHYVELTKRTTWEFCELLDRKFIKSHKGFDEWMELARKNEWIKTDE